MTPEEFKKILGAEPHSDNPDFLEARQKDQKLAALHEQALADEERIRQALSVPVENRVNQILGACFTTEAGEKSQSSSMDTASYTEDEEQAQREWDALIDPDKISQALNIPVENRVDSMLQACFSTESAESDEHSNQRILSVVEDAELTEEEWNALIDKSRISEALNVPVENRIDRVLEACFSDEPESTVIPIRPAWMRVMPIAAAVMLAVGIAFVVPGTQNNANAAPFVEHLAHHLDFSHNPLSDQNNYPDAEVNQILKELGLRFNGQIADVSYLSKCVIDEIESLHMVVSLKSGEQFTVILVPGEELPYGEGEVDGINAMVASLDQGTLFVYGHQKQPIEDFASMMESQFS